jgi:hypothetical protein
VAAAGLALAAMAAAATAQTPTITVVGTLTNEGVECRALRGEDGVLYTFRRSRLTGRFHPGDRVRVEGTLEPISICQQGTTIHVTKAEKAD